MKLSFDTNGTPYICTRSDSPHNVMHSFSSNTCLGLPAHVHMQLACADHILDVCTFCPATTLGGASSRSPQTMLLKLTAGRGL